MPEKGFIIDPTTGAAATLATRELSPADAHILRQYKQFLQRQGLKEALYCDQCWNSDLAHGCEASVSANQIIIRCRCTIRHYRGSQF